MSETATEGASAMSENFFRRSEPGNRKDRARYDALDGAAKIVVEERAFRLYDGSRTVARCWKEAMDSLD